MRADAPSTIFSNNKNYGIPNSPVKPTGTLSEGNAPAKADMILGMRQYDAAAVCIRPS